MEEKAKCPKCGKSIIKHGTYLEGINKGGTIHQLFYCNSCKLSFKTVNGKIIENYTLKEK
ncbi:MAG: hypothetical protein ACLROI_11990 [Beduini sp.]|uniref:hypothetical protein n=1 Tax=Beduini sp. TaxID=1922300 RepID=UPI0039905C06